MDVRDPGNLGTVIRTADAAGVDAVVCCDGTVDPTNPKCVRATAGSLFHVPVVEGGTAAAAVAELSARGFTTVATVVRGGTDYAAFDWTRPVALVLGNEAGGLSDELVASLDAGVTIPMAGRSESLNVSVSAAVLCFEALRQRRAPRRRGPGVAGGPGRPLYDVAHGRGVGATGRRRGDPVSPTGGPVDVDALVAEARAAIEVGRHPRCHPPRRRRGVGQEVGAGRGVPGARFDGPRCPQGARPPAARGPDHGRGAARVHVAREIRYAELAAEMAASRLDLTEYVPGSVAGPAARGHLHLVSQTRDALEDVFVGMGFDVAEGPEIETDWYNFGALNIPPAHPARGMWDTFYLDLGEPESTLLRTHTSPVQIHLMERAVLDGTLPIHSVMPGRCYRRDTPDARHLAVFHQIEGLVVDRGITFADLAGTIETFTAAYFGPDIHSRLRPAYFPFTEPSAEFEVTCTICRGEGCRTCSQTGWIELGGCGMVDPAVFAAVGIDADVWTGFAFGFGIDRCAQMRHQIADMRALIENDIRFLRQF